MSFAAVVMRRTALRLIKIQAVIVTIISLLFYLFAGLSAFLAAFYGGGIVILGSLLMAWRITRAGETGVREKQQGYVEVYLGFIQKFFLTMILLAIGMGWLKLSPIIMLIAFALTHLSYLFNRVDTRHEVKD